MLERKWSSETLSFGFTAVPNLLLRINGIHGTRGTQRLTPSEMFVLLMMLSYWIDEYSDVFPSIRKISTYTGLSTRHVRRIIKSLREKEYISFSRSSESSSRKNVYKFDPIVDKLKLAAFRLENSIERVKERRLTRVEIAESLGLIGDSNMLDLYGELDSDLDDSVV